MIFNHGTWIDQQIWGFYHETWEDIGILLPQIGV